MVSRCFRQIDIIWITFCATEAQLFDFCFEMFERVVTSKANSPPECHVTNVTKEDVWRRRSGDLSLIRILDFKGLLIGDVVFQGLVDLCQVAKQRRQIGEGFVADATLVEVWEKQNRNVSEI